MAKIMVAIGFLVAFAAGLTVGLELRRTSVAQAPPADPATRSTTGPTTRGSGGRSPGGWFASQLGLSREKQKEMEQIWSEVARGGRGEMEKRRRELRNERDEAILALVGAENQPKYDAILQKYEDEQRAMEREMRRRFEDAVERTKALLTPEQRAKYEALLARHRPPERDGRDGRGRGGPGGPGGHKSEHRRGDGGATPTPAPQP